MANPVVLAGQPVPLQAVTAPGFNAVDIRRAISALAQEGVVAATDFKVSQDTGANMRVSVALGEALVTGDSVLHQGEYYCRLAAADNTLDVPAADGANPRIDQIVLEVKDDIHDGSGLSQQRLRTVAGTPTAGATLANRNGAAALPSSCLRLADVLVPAASAAVTTANILDRRPWARGAFVRMSGSQTGTDYSRASNVMADMDATNMLKRLECSGAPVRVTFMGYGYHNTAANGISIRAAIDAAIAEGLIVSAVSPAGNANVDLSFSGIVIPTPGSHLFSAQYSSPNNTANANIVNRTLASATGYPQFTVEELPRQNIDNA